MQEFLLGGREWIYFICTKLNLDLHTFIKEFTNNKIKWLMSRNQIRTLVFEEVLDILHASSC